MGAVAAARPAIRQDLDGWWRPPHAVWPVTGLGVDKVAFTIAQRDPMTGAGWAILAFEAKVDLQVACVEHPIEY
ncbi:hypothetical protein [Streptomyces cellulosae]|uniref:hypothetical protein n=1 Tax=Streptomyces cellulosae TaxID=1968 RepID=UPI0004C72035|nr:hypothetical protein [Streptomyces cellulosae]